MYVKRRECEITIECEPSDLQIEGNASAIDPEQDERTYRYIRRHLDRGNTWAWCTVIVRATWGGFEGRSVLGGCSYPSERAFKRGGYWPDMVAEAIAELNQAIGRAEHG